MEIWLCEHVFTKSKWNYSTNKSEYTLPWSIGTHGSNRIVKSKKKFKALKITWQQVQIQSLRKSWKKSAHEAFIQNLWRLLQLIAVPSEYNQSIVNPIYKSGDTRNLPNYQEIPLPQCQVKFSLKYWIIDYLHGFKSTTKSLETKRF